MLVRFDMSEYSCPSSVMRLIGAPPSYHGYHDGGQLTEKIRRRPYSVILFDEAEKADYSVMNVFLQLLDDGVLTDGQGWNVDFKNTIIIMMSNLGANHLTAGNTLKVAHDLLMKQVRKYFKPELLNRLSEIVIFEPLSHHQLKEIVNIQMKEIIVRVDVILKDAALDVILSESYNPGSIASSSKLIMYGARPIKRWVEKNIITIICKMLVNGEADEGSIITTDAAMDKKGLKFQLRPENPEPMVSSRREKVKDIHVGTKTW
ncbi:hypothetical protein VPH35_101919 [Triticum aestivum]